jgi:hypothetical protein
VRLCRGCVDRTSVDQHMSHRIDLEIQSFESAGAKQYKVTWLSKDNVVGCLSAIRVDDGETRLSLDLATICDAEAHSFLGLNSERFEESARHPSCLASCVDEDIANLLCLTPASVTLDADCYPESSHL